MSDSAQDAINLFSDALGATTHDIYDGSFFVRPGQFACSTELWDVIRRNLQPCPRPRPTATPPAIHSGLYKSIQGPHEIRVLEIKPGSGNDKLQGALHHCVLEGDRLTEDYKTQWAFSATDYTTIVCYTALSYTWGPPVFDAMFECDGHEKKITKSLEAALKQFRQPQDSIMMWIDQICINQDDDTEKMQQITLMGRIYERARNTAIWLGEAENGTSSALQLTERIMSCLQYRFSEVELDQLEGINLPETDSIAWKELWDLLSRPWFPRVWIIQEAMLSTLPGTCFACGSDFLSWTNLVTACSFLETCGISRRFHEKYGPGLKQDKDVCEVVGGLESERSDYQMGPRPAIFRLLTRIRNSKCYNPKDRIYGLLGVCADRDREDVIKNDRPGSTAAELYINMVTHHLRDDLSGGMRVTKVLAAVDHESSGLPSWVPDWRVPPRMTALGLEFAHSVYRTGGELKRVSRPGVDITKPLVRINDEKTEMTAQGVFFDTLVEISEVFTDPDITCENPTVENHTLLAAVAFVSQLQNAGSGDGVFTALWKSLVAGKNCNGTLRCPDSFAEVFSSLLDQTTGHSPSVAGQTYSVRQKRPMGKGGMELKRLEKRTPGQTFQEARTALRRAMKGRRLGTTSQGYLGLFSGHAGKGDAVYVFEACALPLTLRSAGNGKFRFIGECFVQGIMEGEAFKPEDAPMADMTLG